MVLLHEGRVALEGSPEEFRETNDPVAGRFLRGEITAEDLERIHKSGDDVPARHN